MSKFIGVAEVEEGDEVRITMAFDDGAESVTTGRVRHGYNVVTGRSEWSIGAMHIGSLTKFPMVKNYTIELLLWKYDSEWKIVKSPHSGGLVPEGTHVDGPSDHRYFIGTELPG